MYKQDSAGNNLQGLVCRKLQPTCHPTNVRVIIFSYKNYMYTQTDRQTDTHTHTHTHIYIYI